MNVKQIVIESLLEEVNCKEDVLDVSLKLKELGVSSIAFFKIIVALTEELEINLLDIDTSRVSLDVSTEELIDYLSNITTTQVSPHRL